MCAACFPLAAVLRLPSLLIVQRRFFFSPPFRTSRQPAREMSVPFPCCLSYSVRLPCGSVFGRATTLSGLSPFESGFLSFAARWWGGLALSCPWFPSFQQEDPSLGDSFSTRFFFVPRRRCQQQSSSELKGITYVFFPRITSSSGSCWPRRGGGQTFPLEIRRASFRQSPARTSAYDFFVPLV